VNGELQALTALLRRQCGPKISARCGGKEKCHCGHPVHSLIIIVAELFWLLVWLIKYQISWMDTHIVVTFICLTNVGLQEEQTLTFLYVHVATVLCYHMED
jgi:hypothetical protein